MRAVAECYSLDVKFLSHTHVFEQLERLCWEMVAPLGGGRGSGSLEGVA